MHRGVEKRCIFFLEIFMNHRQSITCAYFPLTKDHGPKNLNFQFITYRLNMNLECSATIASDSLHSLRGCSHHRVGKSPFQKGSVGS